MTHAIARTAARTIAAALLATTALASPAFGQAAGPLERQAPDENGVDVVTGKMNMAPVTLSAGPPGEGLTFVSGFAGGRRYDSFNVELEADPDKVCVVIGGHRRCFTRTTPQGLEIFTSREGDGATLTHQFAGTATERYTYTDRNGTVFLFLNEYGDAVGTITARLRTITAPSGELVTYTYRKEGTTARAQSVVNNRGYQLKPTYASDVWETTGTNAAFKRLTKVTAINNAVEYCAPGANSCTLTQDWPSLDVASTSKTLNFTDKTGKNHFYMLAGGELVSATKPGDIVAFAVEYDEANRVKLLSRGSGNWTYSYVDHEVQGKRTTRVTPPLLGSAAPRTYVSDLSSRRVESVTDELGRKASFGYDGSGRMTSMTLPEGNGIELTYDARGNVEEQRVKSKPDEAGARLPDIITSADYPDSCTNPNTCNKPISTTDARGFTTNYSYSSVHDGLLSITSPAPSTGAARPQVRYSYSLLRARYKDNSLALVDGPQIYRLTGVSTCHTGAVTDTETTCIGKASETRTTIGYGDPDPLQGHNLLATAVTQAAGDGTLTATTRYGYDHAGRLTALDGPLFGAADMIRYRYDAAGRRVGTIYPDPDGAGPMKRRAERIVHDFDSLSFTTQSGTVEGPTVTDWNAFTPLEQVVTGVDNFGRTVSRLVGAPGAAAVAVTRYSYDEKGRLACASVQMTASSLYDACTAAEGNEGPDRITQYRYNAADEVTSVRTGVGTTTAERREAAYVYSANGLQRIVTDAENNRTSFAYDRFDRLYRTRYPMKTKGALATASNDYEELGYDAGSNVVSRKLRDNDDDLAADNPVIGYGYDNLGRMILKDLPGTEPDTSYAYDNLGRVKSATQGSHALAFTYDALGRNRSQSGPLGEIFYVHDEAGRRTRMTWPDGFYVVYDYDDAGGLTRIRENGATSGAGVLATFGYDDLGRRISLTRGNGTVTNYDHDVAGRLETLGQDLAGTSADVTLGFGYNRAGQIVSNTRSKDLYALIARPLGNIDYEAGGLNQLTKIGAAVPTHDGRGNLTSDGTNSYSYSSENLLVTGPNGAALSYDPMLRLYETNASNALTRRFAYDGADLIAEYDSNNAVARRHVHGPDVDEPLVTYEGSDTSTRRWLHADERGSIIASSNVNGTVVANNKYDEYGVPGSGNEGRFQYTGQTWLAELGLYYYKARMYDPNLGRFLQTDPIGYEDGLNLYAYVGNDPVNFVDPLGQACEASTPYHVVVCGSRLPSGGSAGGRGGNPTVNPNVRVNEDEGLLDRLRKRLKKITCSPKKNAKTTGTLSRIPVSVTFDSPSEIALLQQYFAGDTTPYRMSSAEFSAAQRFVEQYPNRISSRSRQVGPYTEANVFFGTSVIADPALDGLLGTATGRFRGGKLVGIRDKFDFDFKNRGISPEGLMANLGVALIRLDAITCSGNIQIPITGGE